ncbi:MAG: CRISPR-associated helicase Cas3' [Legionellales bacterium]|nr:CRISPR-associated helicase Cas3' [Legionellales bacterium]
MTKGNGCLYKIPIAHVKQVNNVWVIHSLEEHLESVANIAAHMASEFANQDWAYLAGLWHDLGKYRPCFQQYIKTVSGYDAEAHIEHGKGRVDHSTTGAIYALEKMGKQIGRIIAYLIAGHHAGLPDWSASQSGNASLEMRIQNKKYLDEALANNIPSSITEFTMPKTKIKGDANGLHLWIRLLFSCLVDADFLDTEKFMSPEKFKQRSQWHDIDTLKTLFDHYMKIKIKTATKNHINQIRFSILDSCRQKASSEPGIFTLTVPTGGGKTLASMAFALDHAVKYHKKRIIVAIPYTSIIEQTANQYREIFGDQIIEHHSNIEPEKENSKSRLATENWDAPIIVTTNVQLFESLFAAKSSRCRKLHNLINSVIIIDEAQLIPPNFLQPILHILKILTEHYGVTLVLSTATQPVFTTRINPFEQIKLKGLDNSQEIIPDVNNVYKSLSRVNVTIPCDFHQRKTWSEIADELTALKKSVLAIVNTRKDCRDLFDLMPNGTLHLSGRMCGEHRSQVIQQIKNRLANNEVIKVISTQLVEAGVDLDFPVVYRALAGLDSIVQAAGRCNREGKFDKGEVIVFMPPKQSPRGMLLHAEQSTINVWHNLNGDPLDHHLFINYFNQYFDTETDEHKILDTLIKDAQDGIIQFRTAAKNFQIIDDTATRQILVPYKEEGKNLIEILEKSGPERYLLRKLQRYTVNIYEYEFKQLLSIGAIAEVALGIFSVIVSSAYSEECGLLVSDDLFSTEPENMIF